MNTKYSHNLPLDIIILILEYDNKIKYRNGKFINQISNNDSRIEIINKSYIFKYQYYMEYSYEAYSQKEYINFNSYMIEFKKPRDLPKNEFKIYFMTKYYNNLSGEIFIIFGSETYWGNISYKIYKYNNKNLYYELCSDNIIYDDMEIIQYI